MQAMKMEKDAAMDKADTCEGQAKDANLRADKVTYKSIGQAINSAKYAWYYVSLVPHRLWRMSVKPRRNSNKLRAIWKLPRESWRMPIKN